MEKTKRCESQNETMYTIKRILNGSLLGCMVKNAGFPKLGFANPWGFVRELWGGSWGGLPVYTSNVSVHLNKIKY